MKEFTFFIDELGTTSVNDPHSMIYVLFGCALKNDKASSVKTYADHIKFKYWGRTNVVFHSREMSRCEGEFNIFKHNKNLGDQFTIDLLKFLKEIPILAFAVVVDKVAVKKKNWNEVKINKESSRALIKNYVLFLLRDNGYFGKIVVESASSGKDLYYLKDFSYFISPGNSLISTNWEDIRNKLTSISFVTKKNNDTEEQIADLLAYGALCKFNKDCGVKEYVANSYEAKLIKILESKLCNFPSQANPRKKVLNSQINSFLCLN
jgi:hypothetical protein